VVDAERKRRRRAVAMGALCVACVVVLAPVPVAAVSDVCVARTSSSPGNLRWQLRQASGLTSLTSMPNVLFTHNDRGIKDSPAPGEDTTDAAVWAIGLNGQALARFRLTSGGNPIPYFDTEAISRDPQGRLVLADTGTNVDGRVTVAVYRFTPPVVTAGQAYVAQDVAAEVIPLAYYANATTSTRTKLNVEAMAIDLAGNAWFVPRNVTLPYSYMATAAALNQASGGTTPARAVRSTRLAVDGPMTDASFSPDGTMLLVKSIDTVYAYDVRTTTIATALGRVPCAAAFASRAKAPGYGEAVVARNDGSFVTVAEGSKTQHTGQSSALWSFAV
jgi:hypothetical protein